MCWMLFTTCRVQLFGGLFAVVVGVLEFGTDCAKADQSTLYYVPERLGVLIGTCAPFAHRPQHRFIWWWLLTLCGHLACEPHMHIKCWVWQMKHAARRLFAWSVINASDFVEQLHHFHYEQFRC